MKKLFLMGLLTVMFLNILSLEIFNPEIHYPNRIIVAFDANIINTRSGDINIQRTTRGLEHIGVSSFDEKVNIYGISNLERMFIVDDIDWNDNGIHPMNVFRLTIENNDLMNEALEALSNDPSVMFAEFESILTTLFTPNDPQYTNQWHLPVIRMPELWEYTTGDENIIIAITDNGTKWNHVDLRGNIWINEEQMNGMDIDWNTGVITGAYGTLGNPNSANAVYWGDPLGWDFYDNTNKSYQSFGGMTHGTHVAGIAAAVSDNGIGVSGIAMNSKMLITRHGPDHYETNSMTNGYAGIYYSAIRGAHVINCSWGAPGNSNTANLAVNFATERGSIVVGGAGNNRIEEYFFPGSADNAISVASSNNQDRKAAHSNYSDRVTITAPGQNILSTYFSGSLANAVDTYFAISGTSMASPVVAGVVALMLAINPDLTAAEVKQKLFETGDPMNDNQPGQEYFGKLGGGRLNALKAVMSDYIPELYIDSMTITVQGQSNDALPQIGDTIAISLRIGNNDGWAVATGPVATVSTNMPGIEIIQDTMNFTQLIWSGTTVNSTNQFLIKINDNVDALNIPLDITLSSNQEAFNDFPYSRTVTENFEISMSRPGWPLITNAESTSSPIVANLDGTGNRLITIVGSTVHVVDPNLVYNTGFPLDITETITADFAVGHVLGNEYQQIVLGTLSGKVIVINHLGQIVNEFSTGHAVRNTPIIADLNNDGKYEIIVSSQNGNLYIFNGEDLSLWENYPVSVDTLISTNMAVGDVNGDGIQNIIINITGSSQKIHAINPLTGENITGFPVVSTGASLIGSSLVNISSNSKLDIVFAGNSVTNCPITILTGDGLVHKQITIPARVTTEIAINDLNGDGVPLLIFGDQLGNIHVMDVNLEHINGFPINVGSRIDSSPVFADMDADGRREIIFGDARGMLHIIKSNGTYLSSYPITVSPAPITKSPWVGGFVTNGGEILLTVFNGIDAINTRRRANIPAWNTFRGNNGKTASFTDIRTPETGNTLPILSNNLEQNYPNPFNPETTINFTIQNDENVILSIYNIRGQLVKTLLNENKKAGSHTIIWNGTDNNNNPASSGLYFYRIETETFNSIKRMVLMK